MIWIKQGSLSWNVNLCKKKKKSTKKHCCSVTKLCPTLCEPKDSSPPGSSVHGISQARILEWVVISSSPGSFWSRDQTQISCIAGGFFTTESPGKPPKKHICRHVRRCFFYLHRNSLHREKRKAEWEMVTR